MLEIPQKLVFAVDFDGTLVENAWPDIGPLKMDVVNKVKELQQQGHDFILWTCREGKDLIAALEILETVNLHFITINCNPEYRIKQFDGKDCRKIGADYYIDDKALSINDFLNLQIKETNMNKLEYTYQVEFNPNWDLYQIKSYKEKIRKNGNYCPCALIKEKDNKCMCKKFRDQNYEGLCNCGLYYKRKVMKNYKK